MRATFGLIGLLVALGIAAVVVKKQFDRAQQTIAVLAVPAPAADDKRAEKPAPAVQQQTQQIQQQYKQSLEAAMQQARPAPDEK